MSAHISTDELADAVEGLLGEARSAQVQAHVAQCDDCAEVATALADVSVLLAADSAPRMPDSVAARLESTVAAESGRRTSGEAAAEAERRRRAVDIPHHHLGDFRADLQPSSRTRLLGRALLACAVATIVGFAGYVMSASAGLNEPPSERPAYVNSADLGAQASTVRATRDLHQHRFSQAWRCARDVTDGRITGISSAVVDGRPAYLVYTDQDGTAEVTVVSGCDSDLPSAGPSAVLDR